MISKTPYKLHSLDKPDTTEARRELIRSKPFLRNIYHIWYQALLDEIPGGNGFVVEIGTGAGFLKELYPKLIRTDILPLSNLDLVLNGTRLPFRNNCLKGIVMTNVLHHIVDATAFLREAARCIPPGGIIVMIEPWNTIWSGWIYKYIHPELFDPKQQSWQFTSNGPLSGSNIALPWILFQRDRIRFTHEIPEWQIRSTRPMMPFLYLLSGGVSTRVGFPAWSFKFWRIVDKWLASRNPMWAMFAKITLIRNV